MSTKFRNPFKIRASEKIESDINFLKLFSPEVLDLLFEEKGIELWNSPLFIRSSPGAGKSSLLRILEPGPLSTIFNSRSQNEYKELFTSLKKFDVFDDNGVNTLGVLIRCTQNLDALEEINFPPIQKKRLFNSILNAKVIISTLSSLFELKKELNFPSDLNKIEFEFDQNENSSKSFPYRCNGEILFYWASKIENQIDDLLDSFIPDFQDSIEGHNTPFSLFVLKPNSIKIKDEFFIKRIVFLIDDAHKLSANQRKDLFDFIVEKRDNSNIWISERLEGISNFKSYLERDYNEFNLEKYWSLNLSKFKLLLSKIAQKRAGLSSDDVTTFKEHLIETINEELYSQEFSKSINSSKLRIKEIANFHPKFENIFNEIQSYLNPNLETAIILKCFEIIISREINQKQLSFDFSIDLNQLKNKIDSNIQNAARIFLSVQNKIPFFYGFDVLVSLSSNNVEQFISFSSELFEGILANKVSRKSISLEPNLQEKILAEVAEKKWNELKTLLPDAKETLNFIHSLATFCREKTYQKNAPYAPGVTGFAIYQKNELALIHKENWVVDSNYGNLRLAIQNCLNFNLLEIREISQGKKGQKWQVYYLNRWLCLRYQLPLHYGGWQKLPPSKLISWVKNKQEL
ncbi:MAG: hypothetical protein R2879_18750 [Saprospiraceae bacterium]